VVKKDRPPSVRRGKSEMKGKILDREGESIGLRLGCEGEKNAAGKAPELNMQGIGRKNKHRRKYD